MPEKRSRAGGRTCCPTCFSPVGGGVETDVGETAAARPCSGVTLWTASRHSSRSARPCAGLFVFTIACFLAVVHENDVEPPRPVGAELDALLDISCPRGTSDEIDRARQRASRAQLIPAILIGGYNLVGIYYDDMGVGQKIQGCRRLFARNQHQGPGFGDRGEARCQADCIYRLRPSAPDTQQWSSIPRAVVEARVGG